MMVTFVSQCEKKALKRTRRVLDSFANRIGDNTWQIIITKEGLDAVFKLLRKTASKSTAVSCHWIRSRSRSEFLWVVGNKEAFDENGIVPVHYGETKRFIGEKEIMLDKVYANTNGQRLDQHLFGVAYVAKLFIEKVIPEDENLAKAVFLSGVWHDIGKIDSSFQGWIKLNKKFQEPLEDGEHIDKKTGKFSWQKYPRHNELSLLLFELFNATSFNKETLSRVKHTIFWHHAKPLRNKKDEIKKIIDIYNKLESFEENFNDIFETLDAVLASVNELYTQYTQEEDLLSIVKKIDFIEVEDIIDGEALPVYKHYSTKEKLDAYKREIGLNAKNNLARTAIVTADRIISQLTQEQLSSYIENQNFEELVEDTLLKERGLRSEIQSCLDGFKQNYPDSHRNIAQKNTADELADEELKVGVLNGPAGCGKTKIALEWALKTSAKKIYWVCPRVQVCEGIFTDLTSDEYLPNTHIEIVTGEIKKSQKNNTIEETPDGEEFCADIIITTIDQIVNTITTHKHITTFMDFMNSHVVFDEYHEYITMSGFNLLFAELIEAKKLQQTEDSLPNTLLVSATPNPLFVIKFLGIDKDSIIGMQSFNESDYSLKFSLFDEKEENSNPLMQQQKESETFVISNTALSAQRSFIEHQKKENSILFHSKFIKLDKEMLFAEVYESFKKGGEHKYEILRSGPVVQASLNITCKKMVSEMSHAENFLQRLGRLDRFGEYSEVNSYEVAITQGVIEGKSKDGTSRFLAKLHSLQSTKAWYEFLSNKIDETKTYKINDFYTFYEEFHENESALKLIEEDLIASLKESVLMIEQNVLDPKTFPNTKKEQKNGVKIKKNSLRGNSLFVQMAKLKIVLSEDIEILDEYACVTEDETMTLDVESIEGFGDSSKNLLAFMAKKHHNIKNVKKAYKDAQLKNEARDPLTPIYISYTPEDLAKVNTQAHEFAYYYGVGQKQAIGVISLI